MFQSSFNFVGSSSFIYEKWAFYIPQSICFLCLYCLPNLTCKIIIWNWNAGLFELLVQILYFSLYIIRFSTCTINDYWDPTNTLLHQNIKILDSLSSGCEHRWKAIPPTFFSAFEQKYLLKMSSVNRNQTRLSLIPEWKWSFDHTNSKNHSSSQPIHTVVR